MFFFPARFASSPDIEFLHDFAGWSIQSLQLIIHINLQKDAEELQLLATKTLGFYLKVYRRSSTYFCNISLLLRIIFCLSFATGGLLLFFSSSMMKITPSADCWEHLTVPIWSACRAKSLGLRDEGAKGSFSRGMMIAGWISPKRLFKWGGTI